jgi:hypothetical protein
MLVSRVIFLIYEGYIFRALSKHAHHRLAILLHNLLQFHAQPTTSHEAYPLVEKEENEWRTRTQKRDAVFVTQIIT